MSNIKKGLAEIFFVLFAVCVLAFNASAAQFGDNVISNPDKFDATASLAYDVNVDGFLNIIDLVCAKKAAANIDYEIDKSALGLSESDPVQAVNIANMITALLTA